MDNRKIAVSTGFEVSRFIIQKIETDNCGKFRGVLNTPFGRIKITAERDNRPKKNGKYLKA